MHVHAHARLQFLLHHCVELYIVYLCCEYHFIIFIYNKVTGDFVLSNQNAAHVHARANSKFWSYQSIKGLKFYLPCEYQMISLKNKKVRLIPKLGSQKCNARACTCMHFQKNDYRSEHLQMIYYHPKKVSYRSHVQVLRTLPDKKVPENNNNKKKNNNNN